MCLLFILLGIVLCLILLLCTPLDFVFYCNTKSSPKIVLHLSWLLGLVKYKLYPGEKGKKQKPELAAKKPSKKSLFTFSTLVKTLRVGGLVAQLISLIKATVKSLRVNLLTARFSIGLEDPVDYGYLYSMCIPVNYLLARTSHDIQLEPLFEGQYICDIYAAGNIRIFPIQLAGIFLGFILSIPVIKALTIICRSRWK